MKLTRETLKQIIKEEIQIIKEEMDTIDASELTPPKKDTTAEFEKIGALEQFIANLRAKPFSDGLTDDELAGIIIQSLTNAGYDVNELR